MRQGRRQKLGAVAGTEFSGKVFANYYLAVAERQQGDALGEKAEAGGEIQSGSRTFCAGGSRVRGQKQTADGR